MNLKDKLFGVVALTYRIAWVGLILYLIFSKKPLEFILLVLSAGLMIDGTLYTFFRGHEEAKIKIGTSFFTLEIPQFYTGVLIATFVIFAMYYVGIKDKVDKKELKNIINRAVSNAMRSNISQENETIQNKPITDKELIVEANNEYERDNFESCITLLDKIDTADRIILEKKAYLRILSLYKLYENKLINFNPVKQEEINNL